MILFLDTEFTDFVAPELISLGLVAQDGREFYAGRNDFDQSRCSAFVVMAVLPRLDGRPQVAMSAGELRARAGDWLTQFQGDSPVFVAFDYPGDWALLCEALGDNRPDWLVPMDIGELLSAILPERLLEPGRVTAHHALADARALRADYVAALPRSTDS